MRPKVTKENKRATIIGIKSNEITKAKIDYIADREGKPTSTYLYELITKHIEEYTKIAKINWAEELNPEGGE